MRSVQRWRKAWSEGGEAALVSKGPASLPVFSDELFAKLEAELDKGPQAHGFADQTPARRAVERDEHAITAWVKEIWPAVEEPGRRSMPGSSSRTKPGSR